MGKAEASRETANEPRLSRASVGRLSLYLRRLEAFQREGSAKVSSGQLGESLGITDAQVARIWPRSATWGTPASAIRRRN